MQNIIVEHTTEDLLKAADDYQRCKDEVTPLVSTYPDRGTELLERKCGELRRKLQTLVEHAIQKGGTSKLIDGMACVYIGVREFAAAVRKGRMKLM